MPIEINICTPEGCGFHWLCIKQNKCEWKCLKKHMGFNPADLKQVKHKHPRVYNNDKNKK